MPLTITMADYKSPSPGSVAGDELAQNLDHLKNLLRIPNLDVTQGVDVLIGNADQDAILQRASMVVVGSPAPHDPDGSKEWSAHGHISNADFKPYAFYALMWRTPSDVTVAITWSNSACKSLDFRVDWEQGRMPFAERTMQIWRARFNTYRPRRGLQESLAELSDEDDTMVALGLPPCLLPKLVVLKDGVLDGSRTFAALAGESRNHLVAYASYTAELELDIVNAYIRDNESEMFNLTAPREEEVPMSD